MPVNAVVFVAEENYSPNHIAITMACILASFVAAVAVSLNVVEIGLAIWEFIPVWR
jgi:hypothetical protein